MTLQWMPFIVLLTFQAGAGRGSASHFNLEGQQAMESAEQVSHFDALLKIAGGENPRHTPDGESIMDGDIVIGSSDDLLAGRKAIPDPGLYWPNGTIPYTFHRSITPEEKEMIYKGINHWQAETCIKFVAARKSDPYHIRFRSDREGCWSLIGRQLTYYRRAQDVSIGKGCAHWPTVAHEIGHVIGFFHEQSRNDRDEAVHVNWENVQNGFEIQFNKESDQSFGVPYDYTSVMQYPGWAFSKEILVKNTIVTKDPKYQRLLGVNKGLTFRDKKIVSRLYQCNRDCPNLSSAKCLNGGFLKAYKNDGKECACECPPNTSGQFCEETITMDYYDAIDPLPCGGNITSPQVIQTPNYPKRNESRQSCVWDIQAPADSYVQLEILDFDFAPRMNTANLRLSNKCLNESVEIRLDDDFHGKFYCEHDLQPGSKLTSTRPRMIVIIMAEKPIFGKGLRAEIKFVKQSENEVTKNENELLKKKIIRPSLERTTPFKWIFKTTTFKPFTTKPWTDVWSKIKGVEQGKVVKKIPNTIY